MEESDMSLSTLPLPTPTHAAMTPCRALLVAAQPEALQACEHLLRDERNLIVSGRCTTIVEALEVLHTERPDVVIAEMMLADGDAFELLRRMCRQQPRVRVLVISSRHEALCAERLLRCGALGYVMKSAPPDEIRRAIRRVAAGEMHISATLGMAFQRRFVHPAASVAAAPACALDVLSTREFQIFQLIGNGMTQAEISAALCISVKTVESHRQHIRDKLSFGSVSQFTRCALECATRCRLERGQDATCELDPRFRPLPGIARFGAGA